MKKASRVLLKIAHIYGLIMGIYCLLVSLVWIVISLNPVMRDAIVQSLEENGVDFGELSPEQIVLLFQLIIASSAVAFVYLGVISIVDAVVSRKALNNPTRGRLIACMILGAMSTDFSFVGGMLGIFSLAKENRMKAREEQQ